MTPTTFRNVTRGLNLRDYLAIVVLAVASIVPVSTLATGIATADAGVSTYAQR